MVNQLLLAPELLLSNILRSPTVSSDGILLFRTMSAIIWDDLDLHVYMSQTFLEADGPQLSTLAHIFLTLFL